MKCIRVGIIGVGNMGSAHANCIAKGEIQGLSLVAVCDLSNEKLEHFKADYPQIDTYTDYNDLIINGGVEAVIIAVPHPLHADIAIAALEAGLNVLVEKPVDITVSKARKLNTVAQKSDKVFAIMFNQRTNHLFQKAREIVKSGALGELKRTVWIVTNWYRTQHYYDSGNWRATWSGEGGGVLLNQAPHNLDLWQWICGMPQSVTAFCDIAKYHNIEVEDDATIITRYSNGAVGTFITSTGEYPGTNRLEISGTLGKIVFENEVLKWWRLKKDEREVCSTSEKDFTKIDFDYNEITSEISETAHKGILQNFTNAILYDEELLAPGTDGIFELTLSNAAYLSSWKDNTEIELPFDSAEFDKKLSEISVNAKKYIDDDNLTLSTGYKERWKVRW